MIYFLSASPNIVGQVALAIAPARTPITWADLIKEELSGVIKEFYEDRGFGFVKNDHVHSLQKGFV